jgi:ADP-heptose:LPS heptosyltransferase
MIWVLQRQGNELGNFMMMTPALRLASKQQRRPIPVFFETKNVAKLFKQCPFLKILSHRPANSPRCTSKPPRDKPSRKLPKEDVKRFIKILCGEVPARLPKYYVDGEITYSLEPSSKKRIAIFHGCNVLSSRAKHRKKTLPKVVRQHMLEMPRASGLQPVLLGVQEDNWSIDVDSDVENYLGKLSLRDTVSVLAQCDGFISNDTGLYHVAVALKKPGLVLWKQTDPEQNKAPGGFVEHFVSQKGDAEAYNKAIDGYVKAMYGDYSMGITATRI